MEPKTRFRVSSLLNWWTGTSLVIRILGGLMIGAVLGLLCPHWTGIGILDIFVDYGKLILLLVGCMVFASAVVNPFIVWLHLRKNPYPLYWKCLKKIGINAVPGMKDLNTLTVAISMKFSTKMMTR